MTKRRGHGEGTFRQRADGIWEVRVSLAGGKRKSFYGKTRSEVRDKLRQAQRDQEQGLDLSAGTQTVAQFLDRWLADVVKPGLAPKTYASYAEICRVHITPEIGHIRLAKLTAQHVTQLLQTKREARLSPRTVQYIRAVLRIALNRAVKWQLLARNPVLLTDAPKVRRSEVKPLTPEQARQFLTAAEGDRLESLYRVALALGLRLGEALGVSWEDVDFETNTLRVRRSLQRIDGKLTLKEPKTEKSRRALTMPRTLAVALRAHRDRQAFEQAAAGDQWRETGLVFTNTLGGPLEPSNVLKRFQTLLAEAGLPRQRFHDLRHCAASLLIAQGVPVKVVADILGHAQLATTSDLYSHIFPAAHREAAELMDRILAAER
jgi:integrase